MATTGTAAPPVLEPTSAEQAPAESPQIEEVKRSVVKAPPKPSAVVVTYECSRQFYNNQEGRTYYPGELFHCLSTDKPGSHHKPTDAKSLSVYKSFFPPGSKQEGPFSNFVIEEVIEKRVVKVVEASGDGNRPSDQAVV